MARRAQRGRYRRDRTRARIIEAARSRYANRSAELITIDDLVKEAGLARATFYGHFEHLRALQAAVADETSMMCCIHFG